MPAKALMVQGTMSSAGKSLLVTGLCRIYARRGIRVAPYKSQNMSNNAAVCADGGEIGRAQYTQALACGLEPAVEMNPVLLKPEADARSQVILMGKPYASLPARDYYQRKADMWQGMTDALDNLRAEYELIVIEGAGSPVELNLKAGDIVNMAIARYLDAPVLLAGDIDRGGIFAQLLGTLWLLPPEERKLVKGLLVNKFRGDISLFYDGIELLEEKGGVPVLGVIPYLHHHIPEEDAVAIEAQNEAGAPAEQIDIVVIRLPRISNFDDFDPLIMETGVSVRYIDDPHKLGNPSAVILPGTKSTIADITWLSERGLAATIQQYAAQGGAVVGICGGYQMLGEHILDLKHTESETSETTGLGLLPIETTFQDTKDTYQATARITAETTWLAEVTGTTLNGYEIHMGATQGERSAPWLEITSRNQTPVSVLDGAVSPDGKVWGCYIHGCFAAPAFRQAWLRSLGWHGEGQTYTDSLLASFDYLADEMEKALDMERLDSIIGL